MRMPKAARVAFDGEMVLVAAIAQGELLSPSRGLRQGEYSSIARFEDSDIPLHQRPITSAVGKTATTACSLAPDFEFESPNGTKL